MADQFLSLPIHARAEILGEQAAELGKSATVLEKAEESLLDAGSPPESGRLPDASPDVREPRMPARDFDAVVADVVGLLEAARRAAARSINTILTETYWDIGWRIVEEEQRRRSRSAEYGKALVTRLSADLTERFGRGLAGGACST